MSGEIFKNLSASLLWAMIYNCVLFLAGGGCRDKTIFVKEKFSWVKKSQSLAFLLAEFPGIVLPNHTLSNGLIVKNTVNL